MNTITAQPEGLKLEAQTDATLIEVPALPYELLKVSGGIIATQQAEYRYDATHTIVAARYKRGEWLYSAYRYKDGIGAPLELADRTTVGTLEDVLAALTANARDFHAAYERDELTWSDVTAATPTMTTGTVRCNSCGQDVPRVQLMDASLRAGVCPDCYDRHSD